MSFQENFAVYMQFAEKISEMRHVANNVLRAQDYDSKLKAELDSALAALDNICGRINSSILDARKDAEKRGMRLLSALCGQYDLTIGKAIEYENNRFRFALYQHEAKAEELRKLG